MFHPCSFYSIYHNTSAITLFPKELDISPSVTPPEGCRATSLLRGRRDETKQKKFLAPLEKILHPTRGFRMTVRMCNRAPVMKASPIGVPQERGFGDLWNRATLRSLTRIPPSLRSAGAGGRGPPLSNRAAAPLCPNRTGWHQQERSTPMGVLLSCWSCYPDSDRGPHAYQACALPTEP